MALRDAPGAGAEGDRHNQARPDPHEDQARDRHLGVAGVGPHLRQDHEGQGLHAHPQRQRAAHAQVGDEQAAGQRRARDQGRDHGQEGDAGAQGRVAEVVLQVVGQVHGSAHLGRPECCHRRVGGGPTGCRGDPQGQSRGLGQVLAHHEEDGEHYRGPQPQEGRRRGPGGLLGPVQAEHDGEAGRAPQGQAGQVPGGLLVTASRGGQAAQADDEARRGNGHVDVERPAPAQPVRQGPADEEPGGGAQPAGGAEEGEDLTTSGPGGEGGAEQDQGGGGQERGERPLGGPGGHQQGEGGGQPGHQARRREADLTDPVGAPEAKGRHQAAAQ